MSFPCNLNTSSCPAIDHTVPLTLFYKSKCQVYHGSVQPFLFPVLRLCQQEWQLYELKQSSRGLAANPIQVGPRDFLCRPERAERSPEKNPRNIYTILLKKINGTLI